MKKKLGVQTLTLGGGGALPVGLQDGTKILPSCIVSISNLYIVFVLKFFILDMTILLDNILF